MDPIEAVNDALVDALRSLGLVEGVPTLVPLAGGVSCDVWRVESTIGPIVVKQALPTLRVAAEWHAPVERVEAEVRWLRRIARIDAALVPEVVAGLPDLHAFAMRFVADAPVWKDELIAGRIDPAFAAGVGRELARIHAATAADENWPDTAAQFAALRIDPFLRHVADRDPAAAPALRAIADDLATRRTTLIHGDVSPKNILVGADGPVFLDAECATRGDPAFDLAFCATHLLLKAVWRGDMRMLGAARALVDAYRASIAWEASADLLARAGAIAAALLLARIDGKSPVPYLTEPAQRDAVRAAAHALLARPQPLDTLVDRWKVTA